ncbi:uncharacterized protein FOMMEDRAFT_168072 [Fomitiporia mediterranea MF3/22]|uniref:uncharacterized protein n=1 Tax=Fomitiporia mediterranea (strain MF3/22) TaxID=694068 RepID=UPI0004409A65|nr:uncharacterized protein FOMMEDRAFT_168072 [Fomitiporia mediterranea MF3/22]EJD02972.1 hypothetical protein FOMMEDRAFT_168072 [Fomitiporia mediterranea MF3/22]
MDNSDDYFNDSFDLDDNDLAVLDAEEAKYTQSATQKSLNTAESIPPRKRQKISHPQVAEDILDVFLQADGTYGVVGVTRREEEGDISIPRNLIVTESQDNVRPTNTNSLPNVSRPQSLSRNTSVRGANARTLSTLLGRTTAGNGPCTRTRPTAGNTHMPLRASQVPAGKFAEKQNRVPQYQQEKEAEDLKATVEKLRLENERAKKALQDAELSRFAREGEVTILRKKIEKAAQQHAEDLAKIKETKDAASLEQVRIQKEMKEQIERLRTEYIFKQHEVESSTRKPGWSARSKRTALGSQMSPVPVPRAMQDWTSSAAMGMGRSNLFLHTPSRRGATGSEKQNLNLLKAGATSRTANIDLKFPGFENSFLPSSPTRSPSRTRQSSVVPKRDTSVMRTPRKEGKEKDKKRNGLISPVKPPALTVRSASEQAFDGLPIDDTIQDFDGDVAMSNSSPSRRSKPPLRMGSSPNLGRSELDSVADLDFSDDIDREASPEESIFIGIDWSEELHYMLFSHVSKASKTLTFQYLLSADSLNESYQQACSEILEALGSKYKFSTLHGLMVAVAKQLILMANNLWEHNHFGHLRALLELLSSTMSYIPSFTSAVLQAGMENPSEDNMHALLRVFSDIALNSLESNSLEDHNYQHYLPLLLSSLDLIKTITWTVSGELCSSLAPLLQTDRALLTLLDNKQPSSVVSNTISTLVLLASHRPVSQSMLSIPSEESRKRLSKNTTLDVFQIPIIERLSAFLVDHGPLTDPNLGEDLSSILNFFALLAVTNMEGRTVLLNSGALIPCLIHYLTHLTTMIWEDDAQVMQSVNYAKGAVQNMKQALHLLHRLVIPGASSEDQCAPDFDFRQKLYYVPHPMFNGLPHMFVVTIGRLSYADPPDWLNADLQTEIEKLTEPARDLMELIIEGPESDSVWVAYQDAEDESVTENDDEAEAQLLEAIDQESQEM